MSAVRSDQRTRGEELLAAHRYREAREVLESVAADPNDPEVLVGLATACRILDDVPAATSALEQAYRLHVGAHDWSGAARDAFTLANLALEHLGAASVAKGWLGRARHHLAQKPEDPALVEIFGLEAYLALAYDKDPRTARGYAERSVRLAEFVGEASAMLAGNAYLGFIEVSMGDLNEGMRRLECSAAAATAGELSPAQQLDVYCLPLVDEVPDRLRDGIDVLDVGTGAGHAVNVMARAFPASRFTGVDISAEGIGMAQAEAREWGLANVHFEVGDAAEITGSYDLITAFDTIHDQARPTRVLAAIADALADDGVLLMGDIECSSALEENVGNPLAPTIFAFSVFHCLTVSLAYGGEGLGTAWGRQVALQRLAAAGFGQVTAEYVDGDPLNVYFIARKR